jgi:hypothetical protein
MENHQKKIYKGDTVEVVRSDQKIQVKILDFLPFDKVIVESEKERFVVDRKNIS